MKQLFQWHHENDGRVLAYSDEKIVEYPSLHQAILEKRKQIK